jgi:multisubunit Na+/H+ antiporter MnhF subunit
VTSRRVAAAVALTSLAFVLFAAGALATIWTGDSRYIDSAMVVVLVGCSFAVLLTAWPT